MSKPVKIFELKMDKWMKGLSLQTSIAIGGVFSSTTNFDPFEIAGMMQPSLASALASDSSITNTPTQITSWQQSATAKLYAHSATKLYEVLDGSPYTTVDKTSQISVSNGFRGAIVYKNRYVYSASNETRSNVFPVASGSDVQIRSSMASDGIWHPLVAGADLNVYQADFGAINKITNVTGTSGNTTAIVSLEDNMYVRHMVNTGRHLVILADNNPTGDYNNTGGSTPPVPIAGKYRCQILFWPYYGTSFDQIYEFSDSYITGGAFLDGGVYVFCGDNLYVCNIATPPKAIFNFRTGSTITEKPQTPFQIVQAKNSIYWCGQSNGVIYAYGSLFPGQQKVFYQPFNSASQPSALLFNGSVFYVGTSGNNNMLRVTGTGSTRNTATIVTAPIILPQPYKYAFTKVVMQQKLASGDTINAYLNTQAGNMTISASNQKTYAQIGAKQSYKFERTAAGSNLDVEYFEDFQLNVSSNKAVARVEVWGYPLDSQAQIN